MIYSFSGKEKETERKRGRHKNNRTDRIEREEKQRPEKL